MMLALGIYSSNSHLSSGNKKCVVDRSTAVDELHYVCAEVTLGIRNGESSTCCRVWGHPPEEGRFAESLQTQRTCPGKEEIHPFPVFVLVLAQSIINVTQRCETMLARSPMPLLSASVVYFMGNIPE